VHLGDYIYEYPDTPSGVNGVVTSPASWATPDLARVPAPDTTLCVLADYRQRYAQYHTDQDLITLHQALPVVAVWDNHEFTVHSYTDGPNGTDCLNTDWTTRKASAQQAYFEYVPIRAINGNNQVYRSFNVGNVVEMFMLDTRIEGRSVQPAITYLNISEGHMIGDDQATWLLNGLSASTATWKIIGSQVLFGQMYLSQVGFDLLSNGGVDEWDGYDASRAQILNYISDNNINNVIVISGDLHSSILQDLSLNPGLTPSLAVEFNGPSVSSITPYQFTGDSSIEVDAAQKLLLGIEPHLRQIDLSNNGFVVMNMTTGQARATYVFVNTIESRTYTEISGPAAYTLAGKNCISDETHCPDSTSAGSYVVPLLSLWTAVLLLLAVFVM